MTDKLWSRLSRSMEIPRDADPQAIVRQSIAGLLEDIATQLRQGNLEPFTTLEITSRTLHWDVALLATAYGPTIEARG